MRKPSIFISHAGADRLKAQAVAALLEAESIPVLLDNADLFPGSDFIEFMDGALHRADYCLLLWSRAAEDREWVKTEWHAALAKQVRLNRIFLLVGRLEEHEVPTLLLSRLHVDLFPVLEPGVMQLTQLWKNDRHAAATMENEVLPPLTTQPFEDPSTGSNEVYISSDLFHCTLPFPAALEKPAGLFLDKVIQRLSLPTSIAVGESIGMNFSYNLILNGVALKRDLTLSSQGVTDGTVLILEVITTDFASIEPISVTPEGRRVYRAVTQNSPAYQKFLARLIELGLRAHTR